MPVGAVPFPFGVCRICKDKATGLHYGVATCEGCKGFFKRSITKGESFKCLYNDHCDVTPLSRSRCKACRFKRCMETGMSVEAVRMGRIPKTEKNKVLDLFRRGGSDFNKHELIVNPTGSGNFDFNLKTTQVTTNTHVSMATTLNSKLTLSSHTSDDCSDTTMSPLEHSNTSSINMCPFENDSSKICDSNDQTSSFLTQVGWSLGQHACVPNSDGMAVYNGNTAVNNRENISNGLHNYGLVSFPQSNASTVPIYNTSCKQQFPHRADMEDFLSTSTATEEAKCDNPFSDVYCSINSLGNERSFVKPVLGTMNGRETLRRPIASQTTKVIPVETSNGSDLSVLSSDSSHHSFLFQNNRSCTESESTGSTASGYTTSTQHSNGQQKVARDDNQTDSTPVGNLKPSHGFSRGLVNVLIEQVLNSKGGVQVICEKIEQMSKRRKVDSCKCYQSNGSSLHDRHENVLSDKDTVHMNENVTVSHKMETDVKCSDKRCYNVSNSCCSCQPSKANDMLSTDTVMGTSVEETSQQQLYHNIRGISLGMTILFRLLPEHREKIRQYRLGLICLRIMTEDEVEETYAKVIECIPDINERIIGFCNCVPGLNTVSPNDKAALIKRSYYDIWMLSNAEYFNNQESMIFLKSGEIYSAPVMRRILNDEMVDTIFKFANQFNALGLTDFEKAILCAVRLSAPESLELEDRASVDRFHSDMLDAFAYEVKKNHEQNHARLLIDTFCLMPLLETVNSIQRNIIANFSIHGPSNSL